jgi:hypothetical protein
VLVAPAAAVLPGLPGLPVIRWDPIRQVWVDGKTKGVVTVSQNTVTAPQGAVVAAAAAAPGFTQQGQTRAQRPSAKEFFPLVIPDKDWWKTCDKNSSDILTMMTTKCDIFKDIVNCQQLAQMGYLPNGIQSFVPSSMHGGFTIPNGCSSGNLGVEYDGLRMVFNSPTIPIMAVIAKDVISKVFYFGSGVTQVRGVACGVAWRVLAPRCGTPTLPARRCRSAPLACRLARRQCPAPDQRGATAGTPSCHPVCGLLHNAAPGPPAEAHGQEGGVLLRAAQREPPVRQQDRLVQHGHAARVRLLELLQDGPAGAALYQQHRVPVPRRHSGGCPGWLLACASAAGCPARTRLGACTRMNSCRCCTP